MLYRENAWLGSETQQPNWIVLTLEKFDQSYYDLTDKKIKTKANKHNKRVKTQTSLLVSL